MGNNRRGFFALYLKINCGLTWISKVDADKFLLVSIYCMDD